MGSRIDNEGFDGPGCPSGKGGGFRAHGEFDVGSEAVVRSDGMEVQVWMEGSKIASCWSAGLSGPWISVFDVLNMCVSGWRR